MSAEIKAKTGSEAKLIASAGGIFDVRKDGELLYSKFATGRFPEDGEIANLLSDSA